MPRVLAPSLAVAAALIVRGTPEVIRDVRARQRRKAADEVIKMVARRPQPEIRTITTPVTDGAYSRLGDEDVAAVEARLDGDPAAIFAMSDEATRRRLTLNFAAAYGLTEILERVDLSAATPPDDVHSMARGPIVAGGDFHIADLVFDALGHAGITVREGATVLDFGASSGRVLRAVAAGRPDVEAIGCDPNPEAMAWAQEHLPGMRFFVSPLRPPLDLADGSVQMVYAISIWSHFAEQPAIAWLEEMHRIIEPGGALVLTTHGFDCLTTLLGRGQVTRHTAAEAARTMLQGRHHFVDVFGEAGDWGVKDAGWGNAYLTLEWLITHTREHWAVLLDWPGALDQAQDVIVLQRR